MKFKTHAGFYLRFLILLIVIAEISIRNFNPPTKIFYLSILTFAIFSEFIFFSPFNRHLNEKYFEYFSYLNFILLGLIQLADPKTALVVYYYFLIVTVAEYTVKQNPRPKHIIILLFIIFFGFITIPTSLNLNYSSWTGYVQLILSPYTVQFWSTYLISYLYLNLIEKNRAIDTLNKELMTKVDQLQDYSSKIKELTLIEERQRISQNLHDMLGHSLIGLRLHLDALNQVIDKDPEKSHQILDKSKEIIDHSLVELRETVNELNETKELADLTTALQELQSSISVTDEVKVDLQMYFNVNNLDISVKDLIYKTCQEFITNSIKHGHSSLITIKLRKIDDTLTLTLKNNGLDAQSIVASNGINGIKERVKKLNGQVKFGTNKPSGFTTDITIPIGEKTND
ncbi:sensor histidine kinase [Companilactobacillus huachuanensis]|uniref:histidine kinase n=1 Tax=Companilactobacillus huachuanensis TaxID=2559914 RepID=A0ABW1RP30_9LACO|nr:sensor histidine kinase [Companilactobacillus huachuanensis]